LGENREDLVLQQLPRTTSVIDVNVDLVLHTFGQPASTPWTGYGHRLNADQAEQILADSVEHPSLMRPTRPTAEDRPMLDALAEDGRTPHSQLAERTRWTVARVGRRLATLESSGALFYDTDLLPERLGYRLNAMLWLSVTPRYINLVGEEIAAHPEIAFAAAISGRNNLLAVAICRDAQDLYRYLTDDLAPIKHVLSSDIRIRTQFLKQHGSVIAQGRLINPKPPAPRSARQQPQS
jgi:DNA-binding Lrp family transcriptional regulator